MTNTWNGTFTNIGRTAFQAFLTKLVALRQFSTDFSEDVAGQGSIVNVRIVPTAGAAGDLTDTHSGSRFAAAADTTVSTAAVTLSEQPINGFYLTDEEYNELRADIRTDTTQRKITTTANSVAKAVLDYVFNLVTAANFPTVAFTGGASTFDLDDVIDINAVLADAGWPVDEELAIAMILKSTYRAALKKDNAIQDLSKSGIPDVIRRGALDQVDIFRLVQAPSLPPAGGTPATENLVGMVCTPEALAIAMRPVKSQAPDRLEYEEVMVDDESGVVMVYRVAYDPDTGKLYHTMETLFGAAKAKNTALYRIRSQV